MPRGTPPKAPAAITFDGGGAAGDPPAQIDSYVGAAVPLPGPGALTKASHLFAGWRAGNQGPVLAEGYSFSVAGDVTLYAVWKVQTFSVIFSANGGTNPPAPIEAAVGETIELPVVGEMQRNGHALVRGWNTSPTGQGTMHAEGELFTVSADVTLYAVWLGLTFSSSDTVSGFAVPNFDISGMSIIMPSLNWFTWVTAIGMSGSRLSNFPNISSIEIPAGVTSIGSAFTSTNLETVIFAPGSQLATIGAFAFQDTNLAGGIEIPAGVTFIGASAFRDTNLESVTFAPGSQLATIGAFAFQDTNLAGIEIPASVTSIGALAFWNTNLAVAA